MTNLFGGLSLPASCRTIVASLIVLYGACASVAHPVDSLSREEIAVAVAVLQVAGHIDAGTRFALIDLYEPRSFQIGFDGLETERIERDFHAPPMQRKFSHQAGKIHLGGRHVGGPERCQHRQGRGH
jgi:Cu2+-containing amine oxidase